MRDEKTDLRRLAEKRFSNLPEMNGFMAPEDAARTLYELQIHKIELEIQNDELHRVQDKLEISRKMYYDLYNMAPVGYITIGRDGTILETNLTAENLFGFTVNLLVKYSITSYISCEDQDVYYLYSRHLFETGLPQKCEIQMLKKDNSRFWARLDGSFGYLSNGTPVCRVIITDITDHKISGEKIQKLLSEKELILKEIHHRIKNNMSTIKGLLFLQAESSEEKLVAEALHDAENRVVSMLILYDRLYCSKNTGSLSIKDYFTSLVDEIISNFANRTVIKVEKQIDDFQLDSQLLSILGIMLNEMLTNIMKYAFRGKPDGIVNISVSLEGNHVTLSVGDNGCTLPDNVDFENSTGFGLTLIKMLTNQIEGNIRIERGEGTRFILEFDL